jgi:hypothetical protein
MIGFVMGHEGSIGSTRRARYLHQSVAREGRQRRCCYRDQVLKGNELLLRLQKGNQHVQLVPTGNSTGNYYNTCNCSRQSQALAFHSERQGNCKLIGHGFGPPQRGGGEHSFEGQHSRQSLSDEVSKRQYIH